jgi:hypothetical protein
VPDSPGQDEADRGPVRTAFATSIRNNATAFGFSITITVTFGAMQTSEGSPTATQLMLYGIAAAAGIAVLEGLVTRGFRTRVETAPPEVSMLGTALNFLSVAAAVGVALLVGEILDETVAWVVAAFAAACTYTVLEGLETLLAEWVQSRRGDRDAGRPAG